MHGPVPPRPANPYWGNACQQYCGGFQRGSRDGVRIKESGPGGARAPRSPISNEFDRFANRFAGECHNGAIWPSRRQGRQITNMYASLLAWGWTPLPPSCKWKTTCVVPATLPPHASASDMQWGWVIEIRRWIGTLRP